MLERTLLFQLDVEMIPRLNCPRKKLIIVALTKVIIIFSMPYNKGGKKNKRRKKKTAATDESTRYLPTAEKGLMYALAVKMLGNRRLTVKCADGTERLAIIPGKFKGRRHWISVGMLLLISIRDYQENKVDVIHIYSDQDAKRLRRKGELDELLSDDEDDDDCGFVFGGSEDEDNAEEEIEPQKFPAEEIDLDLENL